jgi:hypothetical protein
VVKAAVFVGPNGSGKTNTLKAIKFLLDALFSENQVPSIEGINSCLFSPDQSLSLKYVFLIDKQEIKYSLSAGKEGEILKEELFLDDNVMLRRDQTTATTSLTDQKEFSKKELSPSLLLLRTIFFNTKFVRFPTLQKWFAFLSNSIYFNAAKASITAYSGVGMPFMKNYLENNDGVSKINDFLKSGKFGSHIDFASKEKVSKYVNLEVLGSDGDSQRKTVFFHRNDIDISLPLSLESQGNQTFVRFLPALLQVAEKPGMLLCDEFSSGLHPELETFLIDGFLNLAKGSQLFITSHSTSLLHSSLLRPDQIFITSISKEGTDIERMSSFHPRDSQNFEKMYLSGLFGGVPSYKSFLQKK